ncbi:MAG: hypothetical protein OEQ13_11990, partial [Acidobacteriota bacterium]|nr:hypothetical protein [Acidobacteriota bacterium]
DRDASRPAALETPARRTIPLRGSRVRIVGEGLAPDSQVSIEGTPGAVQDDGRLAWETILPVGTHQIDLAIAASDGRTRRERFDIDVDGRHFFMVGMAELTAGANDVSGRIEPLAADDRFDGDVHVDGRVAFYLKGKIKGRYLLTAQLDTTEDELSELLSGLDEEDPRRVFRHLDPDRYYPVYGDDSTTFSDVDTQGRFYLRVDWDSSTAMWGNFNTGLTGTEFAQYDRSLYGAMIRHRSLATTDSGEHRLQLTAFGSEARTASGHNEFLGTGGSLYYLRHRDVTQGSVKAWVEVRGRDSGRVIESIALQPGRDYDVDEIQGRIVLARPLMQVADRAAPSVVRDAPLDGHEVRLLVDYEYVPEGFDLEEGTFGGRAHGWIDERLAIGGTYVEESRAGQDHELAAADVTFRPARGAYVKAEYAETKATQASTGLFSDDGGLTFGSLSAASGAPLRKGDATALEGRVDLAELTDGAVDAVAAAWYRERTAGYSSARADAGVDTTEHGAEASWTVRDGVRLSARAATVEQEGVREDRSYSLQADVRTAERWTVSGEARRVEEQVGAAAATEGTLAAARVGWRVRPDIELYGIGQVTLSQDDGYSDNDLLTLGTRARLGERWGLSAEGSSGDRGSALRVGLDMALSDSEQVYMSWLHSPDTTGGAGGAVVVGRRARISDQLSVFNESRFTGGDRHGSLAHAFGLDLTPGEAWSLTASLQTSELDRGVAATGIERRTASLGGRYARGGLLYRGRLEMREDGGGADERQWLTTHLFSAETSPGSRLIAKLDLSRTEDRLAGADDASFVEGSLGYAFRPEAHDRLNLLAQLTYLYDLPSPDQVLARPDQRSSVIALEGIYEVTARWQLGAKLAAREGEIRADRDAGAWFTSGARLGVLQARYRLDTSWDGLLEYRVLSAEDADDERRGALLGVYRRIHDNLQLGAGYNFTDFSDDLTDLDYDQTGWFIKVIGTY